MGAADTKNFEEHARTYALFLGLAKWGTIGVALLLILMRIFLVH